MTHIAKAKKERGAKLVVVDPYRTGTAEIADMHLAPLPGTDGALACAVMHVLFEEVMPTAPTSRATPTTPRVSRRISKAAARNGPPRSPGYRPTRSSPSPGSTEAPSAPISGSATAFRGSATARSICSRSPACRR